MNSTSQVPEIENIEEQTFEENDSMDVPPPDIVAYNELRSCADLFRMYQDGILEIQPDFQRQIVWGNADQTRFIDSLIKQLPIPSMCFSLDYNKQSWQVIDGLQRMWSIIRFLKGENWRLSRLTDIDQSISGQLVSTFHDDASDLRQYYTRIQNLAIPVTVIRCDYSKDDHMEYLFTIFHRLNSGGAKLNNQEIRNCIYSGTFNELLKVLDDNEIWRKINGLDPGRRRRYRGQELILRFFAFHHRFEQYHGRLAKFLNEYMKEHRDPVSGFIEFNSELFERTIRIIDEAIFKGGDTRRMSITVLEATLVGIARNIDSLAGIGVRDIQKMHRTLLDAPEFSEDRLREGLSSTARVQERMTAATNFFGGG